MMLATKLATTVAGIGAALTVLLESTVVGRDLELLALAVGLIVTTGASIGTFYVTRYKTDAAIKRLDKIDELREREADDRKRDTLRFDGKLDTIADSVDKVALWMAREEGRQQGERAGHVRQREARDDVT